MECGSALTNNISVFPCLCDLGVLPVIASYSTYLKLGVHHKTRFKMSVRISSSAACLRRCCRAARPSIILTTCSGHRFVNLRFFSTNWTPPTITGTLPAGGKGVAVGQHAEVCDNLDLLPCVWLRFVTKPSMTCSTID